MSSRNVPDYDDHLILKHSGPPTRLDHFLQQQFPDISIQRWKLAIDTTEVMVDGRPGRKGTILAENSCVSLPPWLPTSLTSRPPVPDSTVQLDIIFENDELLVINKPAGIHTHPLSSDETGTLANGLAATYPKLNGIGFSPLQPGLLNRLDRDTSGLVLAAKTRESWDTYRQWFIQKEITKTYLGIVHGVLDEPLTIERPLIHHPRQHGKMTVHIPDTFHGRRLPAVTIIEPLHHSAATTRVQLTMKTGVMHQLRVHCAAVGHALVGDLVYGSPAHKNLDAQAGRLRLHAFRLRCPDGKQFTAPLNWDDWS